MTDTQLYDKDKNKIYPTTYAQFVKSEARQNVTNSTVEEDIKFILEQIDDLTNSSEAVGGVDISISYIRLDTSDVEKVKQQQDGWGDTFEVPSEEYPYTWKKTTFSSAGGSVKKEFYEIAASDSAMVIQTIYARTKGVKPIIKYKQKQDEEGNPLYIDEHGQETTEVTSTKAYDYNFYSDGSPASKLSNLPPGTGDYEWSIYPRDISPSYPRVFMSSRVRQEGKLGAFSTPAQYGQWPGTESES